MVHIKSKVPIKEALEWSHGKIIAKIQNGPFIYLIHEGGYVTKISNTFVQSLPRGLAAYTRIYPELDCQVDLSLGVINEHFDRFFVLDRNEHGFPIYRSESGEIEVFFTGEGSFEVEYNFEIV